MNLILHEAPRLLANILILQPIDERYIWMPTTAILGEPQLMPNPYDRAISRKILITFHSYVGQKSLVHTELGEY
ncbi:MAG: hypothetical protein NT070_15050 [Cyanobacteria bacterium]|nr:hypothetical protein [Cyanobacteriota bacterium]